MIPYPMNDTYRWDPAEGIIGVLGVAPAATADFFQKLIALTPATKDWEHPRVLIDSNPKLPSRGRHLELGETDPTPFIRTGIEELLERGASVVAVPCNTAHILYDGYAAGLEAVVPNLVDVLVSALLVACHGAPRRLAVLGSRNTVKYGLYGRRVAGLGGGVLAMDPWQAEISALIEYVKQGKKVADGVIRMKAVIDAAMLSGADAFAVACTELSVLLDCASPGVPVVDGNLELARHCLVQVRKGQSVPANAGLLSREEATRPNLF
jgi:aspartate racemase